MPSEAAKTAAEQFCDEHGVMKSFVSNPLAELLDAHARRAVAAAHVVKDRSGDYWDTFVPESHLREWFGSVEEANNGVVRFAAEVVNALKERSEK